MDRNLSVEIDADDFEAAQNDPRVHAFWKEAAEYKERLIARGHCRCHLVVNCPRDDPPNWEDA